MKVFPTDHPEVLLIEPDVFPDERGFFMETFNAETFRQHGLPVSFVQDNHSRSARGVLRGLHYQLNQPQGKLVRAATGEIFDVAVDIRKGSPNFGKWAGAVLSEENNHQLYIPPGFAHGFCVLSEQADFLYKCTDLYSPGDEYGIAWNDPDIGIDWPEMDCVLSDKDLRNPRLRDSEAHLPDYKAD
ncbi:MAG: dTDP-4-dehydrorhamnose 3,5-epimerase [Gammaproteobacteria bacterium]|nr:MAG: dTDP-4-dehydrorhamnose 3,5-epimerase [Gammaproteobacteria bacterium]